jgi:RNA polymerase sigma-70 factor (TIGR02957 family)
MTDLAVHHDTLRPLMFSIAYRMLGSVAEAEDVVQDAFVKMQQSDTVPESPDAFATTVTTRLAIDVLRSARRKREEYVGSWLPEPLISSADGDPAHRIEVDESVSIAFLVLLETLSPLERAVFVLREVFGYEYAEIAAVVQKSEANCRQLLVRGRRRVEEGKPRYDPSPQRRSELAERFFDALRDGDVKALERVLAEDVTMYGDGGGKAPAVARPVRGNVQVARFLLGLVRLAERTGMTFEPVEVNGQPGAWGHSAEGAVLGVVMVDIVDGHVAVVRNLVNPDKLGHLGQVGDLTALVRGGRLPSVSQLGGYDDRVDQSAIAEHGDLCAPTDGRLEQHPLQ